MTEPAVDARPVSSARAAAGGALKQALRFGPVALAGAWIGFYFITDLPYIDPDTFRATIVFHTVTGVVLAVYLVSLVLSRRLPGGSVLDLPLLALAAAYLLTTATSIDWRVSLEVALLALMAMGVFYVLSDGRWLGRWQLEAAFMLAALAAAVWGLWIVGGDYVDWLQLNNAVRDGLGVGDLIPPSVPKLHDVGDHPNILGGILAMSLPFFLIALVRPLPRTLRVAAGLALVAVLLALFMSLARSAWIGAAAGSITSLVLFIAATPGGRRLIDNFKPTTSSGQWLIGAVALGLAALVFAGTYVAQAIQARPLWLFRPSASPRLDVMSAGAEMVQDNPLFGTGPGVFSLLYPEYSGAYPNHAFHSHNGFLQAAVDMGVPGVLAMLLLTGALVWLIIRGLRRTEGESQLSIIAAAGAFVALAAFAQFDAPNGFKGPLVALAAVGAIVVLATREGKTNDSGSPPPPRWYRSIGGVQLLARATAIVAIAGLLIMWGRLDAGHYQYSNALANANAGRFAEAIDDAKNAVDLDPDFAIYRLQRGSVLGQAYLAGDQGSLDGAIAELQRAVELEPRSAIGHANLAMLYADSGDREGAREEALLAREFSNRDPAVVLAAGVALEQANWGDDAIAAYANVLVLDSNLADSLFWIGSPFRVLSYGDIIARSAIVFNPCVLLEISRNQPPEGPISRDDVIEGCKGRIVERDEPSDRIILGNALIDEGKLDEALLHIDRVTDRETDNGPARTALGRWHAAQGDLDAARDQWLQAALLEDAEALVLLGDSYPEGQVPDEVVSELRALLDGSASEVQRHLIGILYYRLKFYRASPQVILLPGEWQTAVPGDYARAQAALLRWEQ